MAIGDEPNDRRFGFWDDTEDVAVHTLGTKDLTSMFGIPQGFHLFIEHMIITVENGESVIVQFDAKNRRRAGAVGTAQITGVNDGNGSMMPSGRSLIASGVTGQLQQQVKVLNIPVYDEIEFTKGAANDIRYEFYYHFERGAMMWLDEWAALIRDKTNAPFAHAAGRAYRQVGDYYQLNKRLIV